MNTKSRKPLTIANGFLINAASVGMLNKGFTEAIEGGKNSLTQLRLLFALLVLIDHAVAIAVPSMQQLGLQRFTFGYLAVNGFFILSGILLARSLSQRGFTLFYVRDRILRIYPALLFFLAIATFVVGPLVAGKWFQWDREHFYFLVNGLLFLDTSTGPVGFYLKNPWPQEYGGQLWTLRHEIIVYFLAPFLYLLHRYYSKHAIGLVALFAATAVILIVPSEPNTQITDSLPGIFIPLSRLGFCFILGTIIWSERRRVAWFVALGMAGIAALFWFPAGTGLGDISATLMVVIPIVIFTLIPPERLTPRAIKELPDLSYGVYLWHYPIMQILLGSFAVTQPLRLFILAVPLSLLAGAVSWFLVEKPALKLRSLHSAVRPKKS